MNTIERLKAVVGERGWVEDPADVMPYVNEWRGNVVGSTPIVLLPQSTAEVSAIMKICHETRTAIVPQGGNTGMCAAAIPDASGTQIVLGLARMKQIRKLDPCNFSMVVDAGCVLENVQNAAREEGRHFAVSIGSSGSCQIGGNLATNAGGLNVLRYGTAREQVLGLEVVLADGRVLDGLRELRKDTAGFDLKQLFIGSEGTLGIITAAALKLHPDPGATVTAMVALQTAQQAIDLLSKLRADLGDVFEAFELISGPVLRLVTGSGESIRAPLEASANWYVLTEAAVSEEVLLGCFEKALASHLVADGVIAKNATEAAALWRMRHGISEAERRQGPALKHDISVPVARLPEFLEEGDQLLAQIAPNNTLLAFGHIGDGNLHYNVALDGDLDDPAAVTSAIYELVRDFGGSFSAEHGVGTIKRHHLDNFRSDVEIDLMRGLKKMLDPRNILNPGKVI